MAPKAGIPRRPGRAFPPPGRLVGTGPCLPYHPAGHPLSDGPKLPSCLAQQHKLPPPWGPPAAGASQGAQLGISWCLSGFPGHTSVNGATRWQAAAAVPTLTHPTWGRGQVLSHDWYLLQQAWRHTGMGTGFTESTKKRVIDFSFIIRRLCIVKESLPNYQLFHTVSDPK